MDYMGKILKEEWDQSHNNKDNYTFYPKEDIVRFLNGYIRKRTGINNFVDKIDFSKKVKGLCFGCGIGREVVLLEEFGIEAYGTDISKIALDHAKDLACFFKNNELKNRLILTDGVTLPFEDYFFDISVSAGVLDSMYFDIAKKNFIELARVTKKYIYFSVISGDDPNYYREFSGDVIVKTEHEKDTIQSYYNFEKIKELISETDFEIIKANLVMEQSVISNFKNSRYHVVVKRKGEL